MKRPRPNEAVLKKEEGMADNTEAVILVVDDSMTVRQGTVRILKEAVFIQKPVTPSKLLLKVREVLDG